MMNADPASAGDAPVMENVTRMDRTLYFEAVSARARRGWGPVLAMGGVVIAVVGLLMRGRTAAVLGLVITLAASASPFIIGRRDFQRLCELHPGGVWEKTVRFYSDRLESDAGGGRVTAAPYRAIKRTIRSGRLYIIEFGREYPAAALDTGGFTQGSAEKLDAFLTEVRRAAYDAPEGENNVDQQGTAL